MLTEVDVKTYRTYFPSDPHPFISEKFIELNKGKVERIVRLVCSNDKPTTGLIAGIKDGILKTPFSAPFGGIHFRTEIVYISQIDNFLSSLKEYLSFYGFRRVEMTLPPDIYQQTVNAKTINSLFRNGFKTDLPDLTNWIDLNQFKGMFTQKNSREYYRQALRNRLSFSVTSVKAEKRQIFDLICENRAMHGRLIYMTFDDILDTGNLWSVDFFKVVTSDYKLVASAIFYRFRTDICYAVFWGDNEEGRPLRAMDFLVFNLLSFYKDLGYIYIDLGISTESGNPNEGLLRFKESHEATSSLRYKFYWCNES
jgi:hypothetical protein